MDITKVTAAHVRLGFKLFALMSEQQRTANIFFSPLSISICLAMVYNGAAGDTKQAMSDALELHGMSIDEVNQANLELGFPEKPQPALIDDKIDIPRTNVSTEEVKAAYRTIRIVQDTGKEQDIVAQLGEDYFMKYRTAIFVMMNFDKSFRLTLANSLWCKKGLQFKPEFIEILNQFYKAEVADLDFDDPRATETINQWVSDATQGTIRDIVARIDPGSALVLANAIYFKGFWQEQFRVENTEQTTFHLLNDQQQPCQMMYLKRTFNYWEDEILQAVSLAYEATDASMYVILPRLDIDFIDFQKQLTAEKWELIVNKTDDHRDYGELFLPRFGTEYERSLAADFKALGMQIAFDPNRADFSAICATEPMPWISDILHKAFIKVDEEGTEAGAATVVMHAGGKFSDEPEVKFRMVVDRPFFYAIADRKNGEVLFMGVLVNP
jgi:serine protease inhibitor